MGNFLNSFISAYADTDLNERHHKFVNGSLQILRKGRGVKKNTLLDKDTEKQRRKLKSTN